MLFACGVLEIAWRRVGGGLSIAPFPALLAVAAGGGTFASIAWVAFKVGALSYGGGFVIIPLMQADAVERYGWMTDTEFLNAVALGQVTPGPVTHTVAAVGYAAAGVPGALLAALVAFAPSFAFVLVGARRFDRFVANRDVRSFFDGAGPAAIGAILGSAIPLTLALAGDVAVRSPGGCGRRVVRPAAGGRLDAARRGRRWCARRGARRTGRLTLASAAREIEPMRSRVPPSQPRPARDAPS